MSDDLLEQRGFVDIWSRLLAIGSLILAGLTLYWNYLNLQDMPRMPDIESKIAMEVGKLATDVKAQQALQRQDFSALSVRVQDDLLAISKAIPAAGASPSDSQVPSADTALNSPNKVATQSPPPVPADSLTTGPEKVSDLDLMSESKSNARASASLVASYVARRPTDKWTIPAITLENKGDAVARIATVEFIPKRVIDNIPREVYGKPLPASDTSAEVISFTAFDNTSRKNATSGEALHGRYEHLMYSSLVLEPDTQRPLVLGIESRDFLSYGFEGRLVIRFNDDEKVTFEDVVVPFVEPK